MAQRASLAAYRPGAMAIGVRATYGSTQVTGNAAWYVVELAEVTHNVGAAGFIVWAPGSHISVTVPGVYWVNGKVNFEPNSSGGRRLVGVEWIADFGPVGGAGNEVCRAEGVNSGATSFWCGDCSGVFEVTSPAIVRLIAYQSSGANLNVNNNLNANQATLNIRRLSPNT